MSGIAEQLYRARMMAPREKLDALMELMGGMEPPPTAWEDVETGEAWLETYDADKPEIERRAREMSALAELLDGRVRAAHITTVEAADWTEAWKSFFHATRISTRIVVRPSWESYEAGPGEIVVDIDPGLSFGTGLHPTTRACLRYLDELAEQVPEGELRALRLVDIGCGSGILAIAAAKLGFASVAAVDNDALAVRVAGENISLNGIVAERCSVGVADVLTDALPRGEVVVANILAPVLSEAAPRIVGSLWQSPHSALVLSGILDSQFAEVQSVYEGQGMALQSTKLEEGWRTGCFVFR
jgi:ribosomal protein L11 methyltransferase